MEPNERERQPGKALGAYKSNSQTIRNRRKINHLGKGLPLSPRSRIPKSIGEWWFAPAFGSRLCQKYPKDLKQTPCPAELQVHPTRKSLGERPGEKKGLPQQPLVGETEDQKLKVNWNSVERGEPWPKVPVRRGVRFVFLTSKAVAPEP
jgi:hypothetical protein